MNDHVISFISLISPLSGLIHILKMRKEGVLEVLKKIKTPLTPKTSEMREIRDPSLISESYSHQEFWSEWFGTGRGVGNPQRGYIANPKDFTTWIQENEEKKRCSYASVQPYNSYETPLCLEKLFYDFDCREDPGRAQEETLDFVERLARFYNIEPLITFSGNKGNHVYIYLEKPFTTGNSKQNLKVIYGILQRMLLGNAEYKTLDSSVIGDISQLARVPYTHHEKTGKICTPIDKQGKPLNLETGFVKYYQKRGLPFALCKRGLHKAAEDLKKREMTIYHKERKSSVSFDEDLRPCIKESLTRSHLPHKMRIAVVSELNAESWSKSRIIDTFSAMADYDRRITEYHVNYIIKKRYTPFKCSTIQGLGECLLMACPIYRKRRLSLSRRDHNG